VEEVEAIETQPIPEKAPRSGRQLHMNPAMHLPKILIINNIYNKAQSPTKLEKKV
jgi:hypothetical protein